MPPFLQQGMGTGSLFPWAGKGVRDGDGVEVTGVMSLEITLPWGHIIHLKAPSSAGA